MAGCYKNPEATAEAVEQALMARPDIKERLAAG
jgi:hypothetical protein